MIEFYTDNRRIIKPIVIPWRKIFRQLFRLSIVSLIVASCTQSITWLGEASTGRPSRRYNPNYYDNKGYHNNRYYTPRSSTTYNEYQQPIEEDNDGTDYRY